MNGIINVLKPPGMTSFDVVAYLKRLLGTKSVGHTGTLDPGVPGVLPICVGNATRVAQFITESGKSYRAEATFGIATDSQDGFGQVTGRQPVTAALQDALDLLPAFTGKIKQIPPMVSAVKVGGKRLYELARQGLEVERQAREVEIKQFTLRAHNWQGTNPTIMFDVDCSKGTYIRTLCADWGERLGCGAHMSYLIRTKSGSFTLTEAWTLEEIAQALLAGKLDFLLPVDRGVEHLPRLSVSEPRVKALLNGLSLAEWDYREEASEQAGSGEHWVRLYNSNGEFLALGLRDSLGRVKPKKVFAAKTQTC